MSRFRGLVLILFFCMLSLSSVSAKVLDRTLAIVNGEAIMQSEFDRVSTPVLDQYKLMTPAAEQNKDKVAELKKKLLDQMIDEKILKQEAEKRKIKITQRDIDEGIQQVKGRFKGEEEFQKELKKENITLTEFEDRIKQQLMVMKLTEQEIKAKAVRPSEEEVQKLYTQITEKMSGKNLGLKPEDEEEFDKMAKFFKRMTSEQVRAKHILLQVDKNATLKVKTDMLKKIKDIKKKIDTGADFSDMAKQHSEDTGSVSRGGDLGYFAKGDMVPEFEKVAFSLDVGKVSEPVLTDFGYHIIKVEEKKAATKLSFPEVKNDLEQYLYQKNAQKDYEKWVKELKSKASIKLNEIE
ncbi:MAG: peptidylprolyl isomerase [Elusimicrobia bacterium]|nr:peptidylprolyl isomerase [Candidatus Liberimonas magnetica]